MNISQIEQTLSSITCPEHNTTSKVRIVKYQGIYKIEVKPCCEGLDKTIKTEGANLIANLQADFLSDSILPDFLR